jgi:hypothetical protein
MNRRLRRAQRAAERTNHAHAEFARWHYLFASHMLRLSRRYERDFDVNLYSTRLDELCAR